MSLNLQTNSNEGPTAITVDVIVPMHNSEHTIIPAIESVYDQINPYHTKFQLDVAICVYDDCSTDNSFQVLNEFKLRRSSQKMTRSIGIDICLLFDRNIQQSMGAGFARNRAAELREKFSKECKGKGGEYLCLLDSDDLMRPTRIAEQINCFYDMDSGNRLTTLMGCQFERIPVDSTWHYTAWANGLSDERLVLEQYRELTLIQPTWMLTRERFMLLGGYVEAPLKNVAYRKLPSTSFDEKSLTYEFSKPKIKSKRSAELESIVDDSSEQEIESIREIATKHRLCDYSLIRVDESPRSLRIAEDLRLFHAHMIKNGRLHLCRSKTPLMIYRHREGMSQSSNTPRQLLLKLRAKAIEDRLLHTSVFREGFAVSNSLNVNFQFLFNQNRFVFRFGVQDVMEKRF